MDTVDAQARKEALDPDRSFIIQAPAGSGKTGLLIQRYLALLSRVKSPEEIIAITFTRKAAVEMKERVIAALAEGGSDVPPQAPHEKETWKLARNADLRDAEHGWNIRHNPSRLKICTIDSLCASLTRQLPILSGFGMQPQITDDAAPLYREAAAETVSELESSATWSDSLEALILHMDNNIGKVEKLISEMLSCRDQWLRHIVDTSDIRLQRQSLESALCQVIETALAKARHHMPETIVGGLPGLARFAAKNLFASSPASGICACLELKEIPQCIPDELEAWNGIADLLLTKAGGIRKNADKRIGFPPGPDGMGNKAAIKALFAEVADCNEFVAALNAIRQLPAPYYTEDQWHLVEALFEILKLSVAHLQLVFEKHGSVDFAEMALRAQKALGEPEHPTDLALVLDYGIHHILVDEFQDTSISQFELLLCLTAGWFPGDAKSFFAVGDPMQSIYSFREAEVGLFLKAWESGLGAHLPLQRLTLAANFRSDQGIVDWVNDTFARVFPEKNDPVTGAVAYSPSAAVHPPGDFPAVTVHPVFDGDDALAAKKVVECILSAQSDYPGKSIAILVRGRSHLKMIVPALKEADIRYLAVEIDALGQRPVISDLTAITRALSHLADRIAWLALLRGPWCGLSLNDLFVIAGNDRESVIYDLIRDPEKLSGLSEDGRNRLERVLPVLSAAMDMRGRRPLRRLVETTWTALGGPACVKEPQLHEASAFFDFLEKKIGYGTMTDYQQFENEIMRLFSHPLPETGDLVQIMTIHKAKGLEFDTVIIPGLDKPPRGDRERLLLWQEMTDGDFPGAGLLLAPIGEAGTGDDPTYKYIKNLHGEKTAQEVKRLLYVAATRARKSLHLIGGMKKSSISGEMAAPDRRSLLHCLWPAVEDIFQAAGNVREINAEADLLPINPSPIGYPCVRRLSNHWEAPPLPRDMDMKPPVAALDELFHADVLRFDWAGWTVRMTGTVIHKWMRVICETGLGNWDQERILSASGIIRSDLLSAGVERGSVNDAADMVATALISTLADETGRWLLAPHYDGKCEYSLSGQVDERMVYVVLDRTFVDEKGIRWIIDYKSGIHRGGGLDDFMEQERVRYEKQTALYAVLMDKKEPGRQIRRALYFPMFSGWSPWPGFWE